MPTADESVTEHRHKQRRSKRTAGRTDGAVQRRLPRCTEISLRHDQRGKDRPVSLRQVEAGVDGVSDGAREAGLDSLLERARIGCSRRMEAAWKTRIEELAVKDLQMPCGGLYSRSGSKAFYAIQPPPTTTSPS